MPIRVLVVDDEPAIRELLTEYLRGRGMEVTVANDAEAALVLLAGAPPSVVVTDLKLPGLDGIEVVRAASRCTPPVPTLVMTGFASVETAVDALTAGANDYLLKPFRLRDLFAAVERALATAARARGGSWAEAAVRLLTRAEESGTPADAEDLVAALRTLLLDLRGVETVDVVEAEAGRSVGHPLGASRRIVVYPDLPAARACARAVHHALERNGR